MNYKIRNNVSTISADLKTPVGIYLKIRDLYPQSALLESSDYHTSQNGKSIIGVKPISYFKLQNGAIECEYPNGEKLFYENSNLNVATELKKYVDSFDVEDSKLQNGLLGFTAYDAVKYFENIDIKPTEKSFENIPDIYYILYRFIIVINHFSDTMSIVENIPEGEESEMADMLSVIHNNNYAQYDFSTCGDMSSSITDEEYMQMVSKGIDHTLRGDVFQIVISRRFSKSFKGDEFNVYRALRSINPSPYLFYFDFGDFKIFGSSPETHLRIDGGKAYIDPIAGTFLRSGNDEKDKDIALSLLEDEKENAEHIMLVDLARNDLARGGRNVKIEFLKQIQYYSHVIHMVSRVSAEISKDTNIFQLFTNTFPAGTLSGAPKVRAMQLINEIEPHNRKIYGGCIGYIGFDNSLNQAITIRSFVSVGNKLYMQAGAGIVAHSVPENELQEVNNKLGALSVALEKAKNFNKQ